MTSTGDEPRPPEPRRDEPVAPGAPVVMVKLPGVQLTGAPAIVVLLLLIAAIVALIVWIGPTFRWSPLWISAALWFAFIVYWSAAAKNPTPAASSESSRSRGLHQLLMNLALVLLFAPIPGLTLRLLPSAWELVAAGLLLHLCGFLLAVWARKHLGRNWSGEIAAKVGHELVRSGPYRRLRHPIYTAMIAMCLATSLVSGELHAALGVALMVAAYVRKIRLEESHLRRLFGDAYSDYCKSSWALVPGLI